jgi:parallel beta-helix repeat protein
MTLPSGYVKWDGSKYVIDPDVDVTGPAGPQGPQGLAGSDGQTGATGPIGPAGNSVADYLRVGPASSFSDYTVDGTADEVEINQAITDAFNSSSPEKKVVKLYAGTYYIDSPIYLKSGVTLEGAGPGATKIVVTTSFLATNFFAIGCYGAEMSGVAIPLTVSTAQNDTSLTATAGSEFNLINPEEYLFLCSDALWESTNSSGRKCGEFVKVYSKSSPTINLYGMVRDQYLTSDNANLFRMNFIKNVAVKNLEIYQQATDGTRTGNPPPMIGFQKCINVLVDNVEVHNSDGPGISIHSCLSSIVSNCYVHDLWDETSQNRLGYGCLISGATEGLVVTGCRFDRMRHSISCGSTKTPSAPATSNRGIPRNVNIVGNSGSHTTNSVFDTHSEAENWLFSGNVASNSNSWGFFMRGRNCKLVGNSVEWCTGGINLGSSSYSSSSGQAVGSEVIGNTVKNCRFITVVTTGPNGSGGNQAFGEGITVNLTQDCVVKGNTISFCDGAGIVLTFGVQHCVISDNVIINCNLDNGSSSECDAIALTGTQYSGASGAITFSSPNCTLTGLSGITANIVGRKVVVSGSSNPNNNGTFTITGTSGTTQLTYVNASGSTDAGPLSWYVESITDNLISGNIAFNSPAAYSYRGDSNGRIKNLIKSYPSNPSTVVRNVIKNNHGMSLDTGLLSVGSGNFAAANSNNEGIPIKTVSAAPVDSNFYATPQAGTLALDITNSFPYFRDSSSWKPFTGKILGISGTTTIDSSTTKLQWENDTVGPQLLQASTSVGNGQALSIIAQSSTAASSTGGNLFLSSGSGTSSNGTIRLAVANSTGVQITPSNSGASSYTVVAGATSATFNQSTTSSANGANMTVQAQGSSMAASTGGNLELKSGTGTNSNGQTRLWAGSSVRLSVADNSTVISTSNTGGITLNTPVTGGYITTTTIYGDTVSIGSSAPNSPSNLSTQLGLNSSFTRINYSLPSSNVVSIGGGGFNLTDMSITVNTLTYYGPVIIPGSPTPVSAIGYLDVNINGTNRKIPYVA